MSRVPHLRRAPIRRSRSSNGAFLLIGSIFAFVTFSEAVRRRVRVCVLVSVREFSLLAIELLTYGTLQ